MLIAQSGEDLSTLTTKEQVDEHFGTPCATGANGGQSFEDFTTRRKISEPLRIDGYSMSLGMTYGIGELYLFPYELYLLGRRTILGGHLRFVYDDKGSVTAVFLDGESLSFGTTHGTP